MKLFKHTSVSKHNSQTNNRANHPFHLLASAIVGRPIHTSYLHTPGARAYSNNERIYLQQNDSLETQRTHVLIQSALIAGNTFQRKQLAIIAGRYELGQRYFSLEVERCCALLTNRLPNSLLLRLEPLSSGLSPTSPAESLRLAQSNNVIHKPPYWFGSLQAFRLLKTLGLSRGKKINSATAAALEEKNQSHNDNRIGDGIDERDIEKTSFWSLLSSPLSKGGMLSNIFRELLDMSSSPETDSSESATTGSSEAVTSRSMNRMGDAMQLIQSKIGLTAKLNGPSEIELNNINVHRYHEWNNAKQMYRQNWVTVEEVEPFQEVDQQTRTHVHENSNRYYQRALANLCISYEMHKHQPKGDSFVLDDLINLTVDTAAGHRGDDNIYQASRKTRRDLGVQILIDVSSSTKEKTDNGQRIFDIQIQAAWNLCRAFSTLGDRVAMHGFHSWGRQLVRFQRLKSFDDAMGATVRQRLDNISISGYTRMGAAIRHASKQVQQYSGMSHKLLLILTDGYPYDDEYESSYAIEDTRKALEEAKQNRVACVCLSLGSDANSEQLQALYGETNYLSLNGINKLPLQIQVLITAAIAGIN